MTSDEERRKFVEECENSFSDRYTEEDFEFKMLNENTVDPPIVRPWNARAPRDRNRGGGGGHQHHRHHHSSY